MRVLILILLVLPLCADVPASKVGAGRIEIRVDTEGNTSNADGKPLADDEAISGYLEKQMMALPEAVTPWIKLLADEGADFGDVRRVIGIAAKAGIDEVIFASVRELPEAIRRKEKDTQIQLPEGLRKDDTKLKLPKAEPKDEQAAIAPYFIRLDEKGFIYVGKGAAMEIMDTDRNARHVPLLSQRVELYVTAARLGNGEPSVHLHVDPKAKHQRVVDVLNVLQKYEVEKVTFVDLVDEE